MCYFIGYCKFICFTGIKYRKFYIGTCIICTNFNYSIIRNINFSKHFIISKCIHSNRSKIAGFGNGYIFELSTIIECISINAFNSIRNSYSFESRTITKCTPTYSLKCPIVSKYYFFNLIAVIEAKFTYISDSFAYFYFVDLSCKAIPRCFGCFVICHCSFAGYLEYSSIGYFPQNIPIFTATTGFFIQSIF